MIKKQISKIIQIYKFKSDSDIFAQYITDNIDSFHGESDTNKKNGTISIVVQSWRGQSTPWYAITLALILKKKSEKNIVILFDDLFFGEDRFFFNIQNYYIEKNLKKISPFISYIKLTSLRKNNASVDDEYIDYLSALNSIHNIKGETNFEGRKSYIKIIKRQYEEIYSSVEEYFNTNSLEKIIIPGGIWGSSGIVSHMAKKNKVNLMSYDSGKSILLFSTNGIAAQLSDIPVTFDFIINHKLDKEFAIEQGKVQLKKRRSGNDMYKHFSKNDLSVKYPSDSYLMLLNSVWDSAALGLHTVYESMIDWILDTIEWVVNNSDSTIIIRQHPGEKEDHINNTDDYGKKIKMRFGDNHRIIFIPAANMVNTYNLIEQSKCVLGFSSSSIVEAVALCKPAIIVSAVYYANFGIVYQAKDKQSYYDLLCDANNHDLIVEQAMVEYAHISNYITQTCNWVNTVFTPQRSDFLKWSKKNIAYISEVEFIAKAIFSSTPISLLNHKKKFDV